MKTKPRMSALGLAVATALVTAVPAMLPINALATWQEVTDQVIVNYGLSAIDRTTRSFVSTVSITNNSEEAMPGGFRLFVNSNHIPLDPDGETGIGEVFYILADQDRILMPGDTTESLRIYFQPTSRTGLSYSVDRVDENEDGQGSGESDIFRKNISKTPELASNKAKLNTMPVYVPSMKADGELRPDLYTVVDTDGNPVYDDEGNPVQKCLFGSLIDEVCQAKPLVSAYVDEIEGTGAQDVFLAISRDDGATWKRKNVSKTADRSSFTLEDGTAYPGDSKKPVFQAKGNRILVTWSDKFCKAGRPAFAEILVDEEGNPVDEEGNPVAEGEEVRAFEDLYGVAGNQKSVDYDEIKDSADMGIGEVPYSCVWSARAKVALADGDLPDPKSDEVIPYTKGDIIWYKAERLTSGRRDAYQLFVGGAADAGFAITWQEDPEGKRPGQAAGPGEGFSGATTNHKTDVWYNYLTWADFDPIDADDEPKGTLDPDPVSDDDANDGLPLVRAAMHMSMPVRISDNEVCNDTNMVPEDPEKEGSHAYCSADLNGNGIMDNCAWSFDKVNEQGEPKKVCVTEQGVLLDGDTGASRPNLFLQAYYDKNLKKYRAWAIMGYEETKGVGVGPPEETGVGNTDEPDPDDLGKDVLYESFSFDDPVTVSPGNRLNLPELGTGRDPDTNEILHDLDNLANNHPIWIEGETVTAEPTEGNTAGSIEIDTGQYATENARRIRFILQGKKPALAVNKADKITGAGTPLLTVYKEGIAGKGRPSDIMLRRINILKPDGTAKGGNPYQPGYFICDEWLQEEGRPKTCLKGALNMSSMTVLKTEPSSQTDPTSDGSGGDDALDKVVATEWSLDNLQDPSWLNPYSEARAHRGQIRKDFVVMGYSQTPNWAASRNGHDKFDLFVRRSFDGGITWTTNPSGDGVGHCVLIKDGTGTGDEEAVDAEEVCGTETEPYKEITVPLADGTDSFTYIRKLWFAPGDPEAPRNVSMLRNNKESVVEPRIVAVPGAINKVDETGTLERDLDGNTIPTEEDEDKQNPAAFMTTYGLEVNWTKQEADADGNLPPPMPTDMYYARSMDRGETFETVEVENTNTGELEERWDALAKRKDVSEGEAQIRLTPDGMKFYSCWLSESNDAYDGPDHFFGSDIWMRKVDYNLIPEAED